MVFSSKAAGGLKLVPVTSSPSTTSLPPVVVPIYTRYPEAPGTAFQVMLAPNPTSSAPSEGAVMTAQSGTLIVEGSSSYEPISISEEQPSELQSLMTIS